MTILTVGIDLAKNVFAVHGVNEAGKAELIRPAVPRDKLHELIVALPPCVIGMEACSGAHHWARLFQASGHTVRLIAPKFVTPYRRTGKRGKNDAADAAAICEAIQRPHMRFVPIKNLEQQSRLMVHRARQGFVEQRTATINRIRGLLSEFGIVLPLKAATVRRRACECLEDLPGYANTVIGDLLSELTHLHERIAQYDTHIQAMAKDDERARQLMQLGGVGPTTATCLLAMIGNGHDFDCGRQFAAWLGLTPGQYSSGGKTPARAHHQGRRRLSAQLAGAGRQGAAGRRQEQDRRRQPLGRSAGRATRLLACRGGDCGQERTHGLGHAETRRGICVARVTWPQLDKQRTRTNTEPPPCDGER